MTQSLTTERLILRPLEHADAERIALLADNWKVASMTGRIPHPYSLADAEAFLAYALKTTGEEIFAITESALLIGCIGLDARKPPGCEIGYWLAEAFWGRGLATEAARALVSYAFNERGESEIRAGYFADNPASGRVLRKLGFRYCRSEMRPSHARGHEVETHDMVLRREDWKGP
jgi:RimJ/RimL family protein N-acetyltransferase